jgi:protein-tyrosine kinase
MSKIEKALRRARSGALQVVSSRPAETKAPEPQSLVTTPAARTGSADEFGDRAGAALAIARMGEPNPKARTELDASRIIFPEMQDNSVAQAFRQVRTRIVQRTQGRNAIVMVTSVTQGGGSSFLSINLGAAFAFDEGKTALVVDCNLRRPAFNRLITTGACNGLTDYMDHPDMDIGQVLHPVGIERLRVIPAGQQREIPAEYFTSAKMRHFLDSLKQRYRERYIILDAPPMTEGADTQILAELCDMVVLVMPYGKVSMTELDACLKTIDPNKLFGVVFNGEPKIPEFDWKQILRKPFSEAGQYMGTLRDAIKKKIDEARKQ